ncbi:MAG: DUF4160 domain-containing protein [Lentisphaeria bacterium]|jgi:hypothetical protein|nr:DUF4160 domain-containing protein [Lentisphaeria bacterium]MDY0176232.1 DUF4160 domain-containing protein [Lentisphaeria bacterium]NLZ61077.1 DUF4160 domain-containing protein [Lentisphaerota bacterium]
MPTILRIGGYRFYWYSKEECEPIHIHVRHENRRAKFWLSPLSVARNQGFAEHELKRIKTMLNENLAIIEEAWYGKQ